MNVLLALLDKAAEEVSTYRQRQITMFREAAIVVALITWGVNQLKLEQNIYTSLIRVAAALACVGASVIGLVIIRLYKTRIYHVRRARQELSIKLQEVSRKTFSDTDTTELFYPTDESANPRRPFKDRVGLTQTSTIYALTLLILGLLSAIVNLFAGYAIKQ